MSRSKGDQAFVDAIPELYDRLLVPLFFESYAADLAGRAASHSPTRVLEIAAGTGVLTRHLAANLADTTSIVATDLNAPMLERAAAIGTKRPVQWQLADALNLPFEDASFDVVVCQFGVMFFPDKPRAYSEVHRVLRPRGHFLFNVWDRIEDNEFSQVAESALEALFPGNPPRFFSRTPHGYCDSAIIQRQLAEGGFGNAAEVHTVTARSRAESAHVAAVALCQGTPLRNEIEARDASKLDAATDCAAEAIARRFGNGAVDGKIQAVVFSIAR
jgi:SAM-dependent methyltransferase